jgi:prepilin-type N-terminal cleavage/methylation domain-containing protein
MLLFNAPNNKGFTLIETLIIVIIIGILSAIAAPSYLGMLNRNKVNDALVKVRGALQEAQREAIRKSKTCTVTLNTTNNKVTSPCLVTGERDLCIRRDNSTGTCLETVSIRTSTSEFNLDLKGTTFNTSTPPAPLTTPVTIVLSLSSNPSFQRCLVMSVPLGLTRSGTYSGSGTNESSCTNS